MKTLLVLSALIELGAGLGLLSFPSVAAVLVLGAPLGADAALTVARVGGAALLALGVACWIPRNDAYGREANGLASAMVLYKGTSKNRHSGADRNP